MKMIPVGFGYGYGTSYWLFIFSIYVSHLMVPNILIWDVIFLQYILFKPLFSNVYYVDRSVCTILKYLISEIILVTLEWHETSSWFTSLIYSFIVLVYYGWFFNDIWYLAYCFLYIVTSKRRFTKYSFKYFLILIKRYN